ncbi:MFS general substrate transporter [Neocallimastix lanati (nom. inval.)]|uniref:MFS general substrate transporter n=1 Tax=Neocallimastix californiae TaxID=1754190 RepID=A0A1Y2D4Q9_9FUNG|nr:MFS general substrate transporter [Neocallimastix sp. JGI-2020a]ORY54299.1 MFS general substrate transporter [Neocallimastix californiae]|eukprot:ORY54299.1 MFS general substrate transporter [Neocallimastix californiae]
MELNINNEDLSEDITLKALNKLNVYNEDLSEDITLSNNIYNNNKKNNDSNNKDVCVEIDSEKKKISNNHIKKYGGTGPSEPKFLPMLFTFVSVLFFTILNEYCATVMFSDLVIEFNKELTTIQWVSTAFILVLAMGMVFSSFIAKHLYMRTIFFTAVISFVIGSLFCVFAKSFIVLLIGRIIQGIGTSLLMPQISSVVMIMAPVEKVGFYNGLSMLVIFTGSALGPPLSGLITKYLGWRYVFGVLIPIPTIGGIIGYWTVGNIVELDDTKLDILSVILAILGFGGITYGFGNVGDYGFRSHYVVDPIIIGMASLIGFFLWENICRNPIISMKHMGTPDFIINILISVVDDFILIGWITILPFIVQNSLGKNAFISGLVLLPGDLLNAIFSIVGGEIYDKSSFKYGPVDRASLLTIIIAYSVGNIGLSLVCSIYTTASLTCVPPQSAPHASAMYYSLFQFFSALSSAIYIAILNNVNSVSFNSSHDPLINGGSVCHSVSIGICTVTFTISILWSIYYFKNHDNKGNLKEKKKTLGV